MAAARRGGEGGADPDVHSWAPGEVEAPGPAAGGESHRRRDRDRRRRRHHGKSPMSASPSPRAPAGAHVPFPAPNPVREGWVLPGGGGAGSRTSGRHHPCRLRRGRRPGRLGWAATLPPLPVPALGVPLSTSGSRLVSSIAHTGPSWTLGQAPPPVTQACSSLLLSMAWARSPFLVPVV